jgi:hypothetical protein
MIPELESCLLEQWCDLALPGKRPGRVEFLTATRRDDRAPCVRLLAFRRGRRAPVAVAKVPRSPGEAPELRHEAAMLRRLRLRLPAELQSTLPRVLALHQVGEQQALLLGAPAGASLAQQAGRQWLARSRARLRHALRTGLDWLCAFQQATRTEAEPRELWERHVVAPMRRYQDRVAADEAAGPIGKLCDTAADALAGASLFLCAGHGDLRPASILRHRGRIAVADWGRAEERALPLLDPLSLITSAPAEAARRPRDAAGRVAAFRETWLEPSPLRALAAGAVTRYAAAVGIEPATVVWGLPVLLAERARRAGETGASAAEEGHWHQCLRLLADDAGALARTADLVGT